MYKLAGTPSTAIAALDRLQHDPTPPAVTQRAPTFSNATMPTVTAALTISIPQNRGAVSKRVSNQIKRKTTPNYCTYSNEFSLQALRLTLDAERTGGCKLTRLGRGPLCSKATGEWTA